MQLKTTSTNFCVQRFKWTTIPRMHVQLFSCSALLLFSALIISVSAVGGLFKTYIPSLKSNVDSDKVLSVGATDFPFPQDLRYPRQVHLSVGGK
ncbi:hypothetical protein EB796_006727 [Bugula neritina]|uniref:Uncharacterized protein n=1 Tax=Bugula neritina TaxID=10212 RepID=A0A7J7K9V5_BUGNE|nr:hypothetical protein EB796_006727 [Bugula neritina]